MIRCAALYIDPAGPYPKIDGVDCWDEERDARLYDGPHPIVAHPPCGPWGRLRQFCTRQDPRLAIRAVEQVARWGGVLEHPLVSLIWDRLPPGIGYLVTIHQVEFGHRTRKPTKLWCVGISQRLVAEMLDSRERMAQPTRVITGAVEWRKQTGAKVVGKREARCTPPLLAEWLVKLAESARRDG